MQIDRKLFKTIISLQGGVADFEVYLKNEIALCLWDTNNPQKKLFTVTGFPKTP